MSAVIRELGYCPVCSGSGEGMWDGSRCRNCGGSGEAWVEVDVEETDGEEDDIQDE